LYSRWPRPRQKEEKKLFSLAGRAGGKNPERVCTTLDGIVGRKRKRVGS